MMRVEKDFTTLMLNLYEDYIFLGPARHSILTLCFRFFFCWLTYL